MTDNYEYLAPLCVAVAGLVYALADFWINGGRTKRLDLFDGWLDEIKEESKMLCLGRKVTQTIHIGPHISITVLRIGPNTVRVGIEAPADMNIVRGELVERDAGRYESELGGEG